MSLKVKMRSTRTSSSTEKKNVFFYQISRRNLKIPKIKFYVSADTNFYGEPEGKAMGVNNIKRLFNSDLFSKQMSATRGKLKFSSFISFSFSRGNENCFSLWRLSVAVKDPATLGEEKM